MKKLLMGNEAAAYAALQAGVGLVAGYPGTPSSEVVETVAKLHTSGVAKGVHVEWSTNEKAALEVAFGASLSGVRSLFTCKQVGLNVASDALMSLNYVGVRGGLVLYVADDPGPISSQTEQDTRRFAAFAKVPVLDPSTPDELYAMVGYAFQLSEAYNTPVVVRPTTRICHASTFFDVPETTQALPVPDDGFEKDDSRWVIFPARSYRAHKEIDDRLAAIAHAWSQAANTASANTVSTDTASTTTASANTASANTASANADPFRSDSHASAAKAPELQAAQSLVTPNFNPVVQVGAQPKRGIVASGASAAYVREALSMFVHSKEQVLFAGHENLGKKTGADPFAVSALQPTYRFLQVGTPYPFPEEVARRFAKDLDEIIVFEELDYVLEDEFLKLAGKYHLPYTVYGKQDGSTRTRGENSTEDCFDKLCAFFEVPLGKFSPSFTSGIVLDKAAQNTPPEQLSEQLSEQPSDQPSVQPPEQPSDQPSVQPPARPPVLCAGCPHRGSFYAVKTVLRKHKAVLCGDIGCYTLGNAKPLDAVDTCLCMGAGITMAQGISAVEPNRKCVAFVGDSTFFASGLTGVANAVYNNHDVTICVLDNATTAMTGSQPHPGTGTTLMGGQSAPINIEECLRALGITCITKANAFNLEEAQTAAQTAIDFEGPSAVIFEGLCIQLSAPQAPVVVDAQTCTGCKACMRAIGCPAMSMSATQDNVSQNSSPSPHLQQATDEHSAQGNVLTIDTSLCWGCNLCVDVCPFAAITKGEPHA